MMVSLYTYIHIIINVALDIGSIYTFDPMTSQKNHADHVDTILYLKEVKFYMYVTYYTVYIEYTWI